MKLKLLDLTLVQGVNIDRSMNLPSESYYVESESQDKTIYRLKEPFEEELSVMQVEIQFNSNIRVGVVNREEKSLCLGADPGFTDFESHVLRFERFVKMPLEMAA
jgi:hypothetical protein